MDSVNFWLIVLLALAGIVLLYVAVMWLAVRHISQIIIQHQIQAQQEQEQQQQSQLMTLTVEVVDNQYLCYNAQTQDFVCQGQDLQELHNKFQQRYPNKTAALIGGDQSALAVLKQQLKETRENSNSVGSPS